MKPADHQQRARALDPAHSFIVQAPAGSGKTELLVRRFLSLLGAVEAPEEILAMTFTKKAASEMRERILRALSQTEIEDKELAAIVSRARANDAKHDWQLTRHTRRLRIQTIDSLCAELVRRMPWSARFGAMPGVAEDARPLYLQAAQTTLMHVESDAAWADACGKLLQLVDANFGRARELLADMLARRDKWLLELGGDLRGGFDRETLQRMWRDLIERKLQTARDRLPPKLQKEMVALAVHAAGQLHAAGAPVCACESLREFPKADYARLDQWRGLVNLVLTQQLSLRKNVTKTQGFGTEDRETKTRMQNFLEDLQAHPHFIGALQHVSLLPDGEYTDAQWRALQSLVELLPLAAAELRLLFKASNQADFTEIAQRAGLALGAEDAPSDLALAFDYRLQHLLVDEFQDTSAAQIELIKKLTAGWQAGDGRSLFLVGDPMQSIYLFRDAEVSNFIAVQNNGLGDIKPEPVTLQSNFRSAPALVAEFNQMFAQVMPQLTDTDSGAVAYSESSPHRTHVGELHVHAADKTADNANQGEAIAALIADALQEDAQQSIAVLGRTRAHLEAVAEALRARRIPTQSLDLAPLAHTQHIQDLMTLTRALLQPADRAAWLGMLRAPWCGLTLQDMTLLLEPHADENVFELLQNQTALARLSKDAQRRIQRFLHAFAPAFARQGRVGVRANVEALWLALGGAAAVDADELHDCRRYFDLLTQLEDNAAAINQHSLRESMRELWAHSSAGAQVQLLTIHRAKGLEFDRVIIPSMEKRTGQKDRKLIRWMRLPQQFLIAPMPHGANDDDAFYQYLGALESMQHDNELRRLLYVACTRAKTRLHLFMRIGEDKDGELKSPPPTSLAGLLWPALKTRIENECRAQFDAPQSRVARELVNGVARLPLDWRAPPLPLDVGDASRKTHREDPIEFSWAGEIARVSGVVIHAELEKIDQSDWQTWCAQTFDERELLNALTRHGLSGEHRAQALARVQLALANAKQDERAAWLFSREHSDIHAEWRLAGVVDSEVRHVVLDRSFVDADNIRWIVDFKSSSHEGEGRKSFLDREQERYAEQMARYAEIVGALEAEAAREIRLALYFPVLKGWREWRA